MNYRWDDPKEVKNEFQGWRARRYDLKNAVTGLSLVHERVIGHIEKAGLSHDPIGVWVDVGCGTGRFASLVTRRVPKVVVVSLDLSEQMIRNRREKHAAVVPRFVVSKAESLPLPDDSVDLVTILFTLHHLAVDARRAALLESWRVLKTRGLLISCDFAPSSCRRDLTIVRRIIEAHACVAELARDPVESAIVRAGFSSVTVDTFGIFQHRQIVVGRKNSDCNLMIPA